MSKTWTMSRQLFTGVGIMLALVGVAGGVAAWGVSIIRSGGEKTSRSVESVKLAAEVAASNLHIVATEKNMVIATFTGDRQLLETSTTQLQDLIELGTQTTARLHESMSTDEGRKATTALAQGMARWGDTCDSCHEVIHEVKAHPEKLAAMALSIEELMQANQKIIGGIQQAANASVEVDRSEASSAYSRMRLLILVTVGLSLVVAVGLVVIVRVITRRLRTVTGELREGSGRVLATSSHVSTSAQSLSQAALEHSAALQETSASMEEMASMTRQNAANAQSAASLMIDVDSRVRDSTRALDGMVVSMKAIQESSGKVAKIIKTIDEIAFQTNILALNAAVEAARAGEAGMGFAVVADEVRNLAQRSAQAAKDTAGLIEESIANAQGGSHTVEQVEEAIAGITQSVTKVKGLVEEVNVASQQQTQGLDQVAKALAQMEKVTQTTAATAEESAAASEELKAQAERAIHSVSDLDAMVGTGDAAVTPRPSHTPGDRPQRDRAQIVRLPESRLSHVQDRHSA